MSSSSNPTINASEVELRLWIGKVLVKWNDLARVNRICDILLLRYRSKDQFFSANEFEIINLLGNDPHAVYLISRIYEERKIAAAKTYSKLATENQKLKRQLREKEEDLKKIANKNEKLEAHIELMNGGKWVLASIENPYDWFGGAILCFSTMVAVVAIEINTHQSSALDAVEHLWMLLSILGLIVWVLHWAHWSYSKSLVKVRRIELVESLEREEY